ncbi:SDR family NAD(P)-dependent oxidoreductase [Salicibibacter cibi]|uniref:SDR family NAD(P)-dependent oxidoreductase n=1 Tax=Salicibibacter cibi TaxID=2743001 RepID=A0A7T6ZBE7_9BACI|nr:SDR family NAD(P)-dependent oxidoreductase [Salicibibacter cibi]QQK80415.1 SDR family NAD(P)-dependent oxidoreductase [Salicibibacter cibi]
MRKAVIITGTSSGLGKEIFDLLTDLSPMLIISLSRRFLDSQLDLAKSNKHIGLIKQDFDQPEQLLQTKEISQKLSAFNVEEIIFINNAGIVEPIGSIEEFEPDKIRKSIDVNFTSPLYITQMLYKESLKLKTKFSILNISSKAATQTYDGWALYCATKAGAKMFYDVIDEQHKDNRNVEVTTIDPGVMDTQLQENIRQAENVYFPNRGHFVNLKEEHRLPAPEQVARDILSKHVLDK